MKDIVTIKIWLLLLNGNPVMSNPRAATSVQIMNLATFCLNFSKLFLRSSGFRSPCKHTHENVRLSVRLDVNIFHVG